MEIRIATVEDASQIVDLIRSHASADGGYSPVTTAYVGQYLASPTSHVLLAIDQDRAVGLLSYSTRPNLYHASDCCLIEDLFVMETYRDQGIGSLLIQAVMEQAQPYGWAEVAVSVMPQNAGALRFYRRHGLDEEVVMLEHHL